MSGSNKSLLYLNPLNTKSTKEATGAVSQAINLSTKRVKNPTLLEQMTEIDISLTYEKSSSPMKETKTKKPPLNFAHGMLRISVK